MPFLSLLKFRTQTFYSEIAFYCLLTSYSKEQPLRPTGETTWNFRANLWNSRSPQHCGQLRHRGRVLAGNGIQILTLGRTKDACFFGLPSQVWTVSPCFFIIRKVAAIAVVCEEVFWTEKFGCFRWVAPAVVFRFSSQQITGQGHFGKIHRWVKLPFGDPIWSNHIVKLSWWSGKI